MLKIVNEEDGTEKEKFVSAKLLFLTFNNGNSTNVFCHPKVAESVMDKFLESQIKELDPKDCAVKLNYIAIVFNPIDETEFEVEGTLAFLIKDLSSVQIELNESTAPKIKDIYL